MKRLFTTIFAPYDDAMQLLDNKQVMTELRNDADNFSMTWNEGGVYHKSKDGTIVIAFVPKEASFTIPNFFLKVADNPRCFVFTDMKVYGRHFKKAQTPSGKETCAVISREQFTPELIIETIKFMRSEFP